MRTRRKGRIEERVRGYERGALLAGVREEGVCRIVQHAERTIVYEALLTQGQSLAQIQAMRRHIEQVGGAIRFEQAGSAILVTLTLPAPYTAEQFFPATPFFPV